MNLRGCRIWGGVRGWQKRLTLHTVVSDSVGQAALTPAMHGEAAAQGTHGALPEAEKVPATHGPSTAQQT